MVKPDFYQPLGEMCITCVHKLRLCNHLPFKTMRPDSFYMLDGIKHIEVICTDREKEKNKNGYN